MIVLYCYQSASNIQSVIVLLNEMIAVESAGCNLNPVPVLRVLFMNFSPVPNHTIEAHSISFSECAMWTKH